MDIKLDALDAALVASCELEVVTLQVELFQFVFELPRVDAQIHERANEHVAADAAKEIQIKSFHRVTWVRPSFAGSQRINLAGGVARAESIVDVNHGHATGTTVEHAQQRGQAPKAGTVPDARRDGDDRARHQAGDDAGQGAFHTRHHDNYCLLY